MISKQERLLVFEKCNGKCGYCGQLLTLQTMQVDHKIPQRATTCNPMWATHEEVHCLDNYLPSCRSCNNYKAGNPLESFRKEIALQPERLLNNNPTLRLAKRFNLVSFSPRPIIFYFETLI